MSKTSKFNVGDVVRTKTPLFGEVRTGVVVEVNSGHLKNSNLIRFNNFAEYGHCGNGHTNTGKDYPTNNHWYERDDMLELAPKTTKYKVGDKVRVRKDLDACHTQYAMHHDPLVKYIAIGSMLDLKGKDVTISKIDGDIYRIAGSGFIWTDEMFEGLASECEEVSEGKIIIYRKGKEVIAKNTETGETAKATCHPDDAFDFNIGAKLAFKRLTTPKLLEAFESGKRYVFRKELCKKSFETERPFGRTCFDFITEMWATELDGKEVEVKHTTLASNAGYGIAPQWCEELKEAPNKEEPKLYNGKGDLRPVDPVHNLEEFHNCGCLAKFIEVVE